MPKKSGEVICQKKGDLFLAWLMWHAEKVICQKKVDKFLAWLMWHAGILEGGKMASSLSLSYSHPDSSLFKLDLYLSQFSVSAQNSFTRVAEHFPSTTIKSPKAAGPFDFLEILGEGPIKCL